MSEKGPEVVVRRAEADDAPAIQEAFERLGPGRGCASAELTASDHCHYATVAAVGDRVVGYGRWVRVSRSAPRADMVVVVSEGWEQRGIGTKVLAQLRREARRRGVQTLDVRAARTAELVDQLHSHPASTKGRVEEDDVVLSLSVDKVLPGTEHAALRWAARGRAAVVGPAVGEEPKKRADA